MKFNKKIYKMYFVWCCKDIERVYLGKKVDDNQKKKESETFRAKKLIYNVDPNKLGSIYYRANTSNIMNVPDILLERKK